MLKGEVIGNLGADAEVRSSNGAKFVVMRVAHTEKFQKEDGTSSETTTWVDVTFSNAESKLIPFLKKGVKVFVRGHLSPRLYSSPKLRQMVAGLTIRASEIELCGGSVEDVPRQLIDPETAALIPVHKYYWCEAETKGMKKEDMKMLLDDKNRPYCMNARGFVEPAPDGINLDEKTEGQKVNS